MKIFLIITSLLALLFVRSTLASECAFATFINTDNHDDVYNAMALGKSLMSTGSTFDRIAVVYGHTNSVTTAMLQIYGWTVIDSSTHYVFETPFSYPSMSSVLSGNRKSEALLAKFFVFTLTQYRSIVYLDNNVIVASNINELCSCSFAKIGSVAMARNHDIGVMTLTPSPDAFTTIADAIRTGVITEPYDVFNYFFENKECPYYDPLDPVMAGSIPSTECIRLPPRYNGDIAYHLLNGFVNNQGDMDKPKVVYYSLVGAHSWSWWNSIILPQYWIWSSSYTTAINDARANFDFATFGWIIRLSIVFCVFYIGQLFYAVSLSRLFSWLYINPSYSTAPFYKLVLFHAFNTIAVLTAYFWSDVYVSHPIMNIVLFIFTLEGASNILLFSHALDLSKRIWLRLVYLCSTYVVFVTFLSTAIIPPDFVLRITILVIYFVFIHGIFFSYLFIVNSHSIYTKEAAVRQQQESEKDIFPTSFHPLSAFHQLFARPPHTIPKDIEHQS